MEDLRTGDCVAADERTEVDRVKGLVTKAIEGDVEEIARLMVSKGDGELFGKTEFQLRDLVHGLGSHALEATVNDRNKPPHQKSWVNSGLGRSPSW
jgi:hypothetical protein